MIKMSVIDDMLMEKKKLHFTLIDPENQTPSKAAEMAGVCENLGTDAIMIGGSTVSKRDMNETAEHIKKAITIPLIIFPHSTDAITEYADYIFFMSLLNSIDRKYLIGEQIKGARLIDMYGIKPISVGYIIVSTSKKKTTVEDVTSVTRLDKITANDHEKVIDYALAAQYLGMDCIYLEAGSGADKPIPEEMISKVKKRLNIPVIVGGGIRDGDTAMRISNAGADVIVTGTVVEKNLRAIKEIIGGIHMSQLIPKA